MKDEVRISYTLRRRQQLTKPSMSWPQVGDMLELCDGTLAVCTRVYKGICYFINEFNRGM